MRHISVYRDLTTYAVPLPDGSYDSDRKGNPKITRVTLEPEGIPAPHRPDGLSDSQWAFATSGPHRWQSAVTTFGERAEDIAAELARSGCIVLECDFRDARVVLPPRGWAPHPDLHAAQEEHSSERAALRAIQEDEARHLAAELVPYPVAGPLVAILSAQRGGPYRDHAIEAARVLLADGTLPTSEHEPWVAVRWLKRGKRSDYDRDQEPLAEGGQGAVYSGVHKYARIPVALKQLRYGDEDSVHRMGREISIGRHYGEHPNVMPVLDSGPDGRWFVMPLANGSAASHAERLRGQPESSWTSSRRSARGCAGRTRTTGSTVTLSQPTSCSSMAGGSWPTGDSADSPAGRLAFRAGLEPVPASGPRGSPHRSYRPETPIT